MSIIVSQVGAEFVSRVFFIEIENEGFRIFVRLFDFHYGKYQQRLAQFVKGRNSNWPSSALIFSISSSALAELGNI